MSFVVNKAKREFDKWRARERECAVLYTSKSWKHIVHEIHVIAFRFGSLFRRQSVVYLVRRTYGTSTSRSGWQHTSFVHSCWSRQVKTCQTRWLTFTVVSLCLVSERQPDCTVVCLSACSATCERQYHIQQFLNINIYFDTFFVRSKREKYLNIFFSAQSWDSNEYYFRNKWNKFGVEINDRSAKDRRTRKNSKWKKVLKNRSDPTGIKDTFFGFAYLFSLKLWSVVLFRVCMCICATARWIVSKFFACD